MTRSWFSYTKRARSTEVSNAKQLHREAKFLERFDAISIVLAIIVVFIVSVAGWLFAVTADVFGLHDPRIIRPVPDTRILNNIRPASSEYVDAIPLNRNSEKVLIGRRDGEIINYDRNTGIIEHENIDPNGELEGDLDILSSGCGLTNISDYPIECPFGDTALAKTIPGGVAFRNSSGDWSTIIIDSAWKGLDGNLVQHEDITHMAVSDDEHLVFVLAGEKGAAVFNQENGNWYVVEDVEKLLTATKMGGIKVMPAGRQLLIASKRGLGRISLSFEDAVLDWSSNIANEVLDITWDREGKIWAIVEGQCETASQNKCLWIGHIKGLDNIEYVIGEREPHPNLFATDLQHASIQSGMVVTVGGTGVHAYDQKLRQWKTILAGVIDSYIHLDDGETLYVAQSDTLAKITNAKIVEKKDIDGGPYTQLSANGSMILGLSQSGLIYDLDKNKIIAWRDTRISNDTIFDTGASDGSTVIMMGKKGILIHHLTRRRFSWINSSQLPISLREPNLRIIHFANNFWSVNQDEGVFEKLLLVGDHPSINIEVEEEFTMPGPIASVSPTEDFVFAIGSDNYPYRIDGYGQISTNIGEPIPENLNFKSIAAVAHGVYFTDGNKIWRYRTNNRGWDFIADAPPNETISNIEANNKLHVLTKSGKVYLLDNSLPNSYTWQNIFGHGQDALFSSNLLSDAKVSGNSLFLAGSGRIQRYNLNTSGFEKNWVVNSNSQAKIISIINNIPVWLVNKTVMFGDSKVLDREVLNAWEVSDGFLAISNSNSRNPYMIHFQESGNQQCTFFGADPPSGDVIDAILLPTGDRILVMATDGSAIYIPSEHRWISVNGLPTQTNARLFISNSHLIIASPNQLRALEFKDLPNLNSCDNPNTAFNFTVNIHGKHISVSEESSEAVVLKNNGEIYVWDDGTISNILPDHGEKPDTSSFVRVVEIPDGFLFATLEKLWSYNLQKRIWKSFPLKLPTDSGDVISIDMIGGSSNVPINVWTDKSSFQGEWNKQATVTMYEIRMDRGLKIKTEATEILDVSENRRRVAVSSSNGLEIIDMSKHNGSYRIEMPPRDNLIPNIRYFKQNDNVHVISNESETLFYFLPTPISISDKTVKLTDIAYRYEIKADLDWGIDLKSKTLWRITEIGELMKCNIQKGQTTDNCIKEISEPLEINKSEVNFAFFEKNFQYLRTNSGWLRLTNQLRMPEIVEAPKVPKLENTSSWQNGILITPPDDSLHFLSHENSTSTELSKNILYVRTDSRRIHIANNNGLLVFDYIEGNLKPNFQYNKFNYSGINWLETRSSITGLSSDGHPVDVESGNKLGPKLFHSRSIKSLIREDYDHFWLQRKNGQVELVKNENCHVNHHQITTPCFLTIETIDKNITDKLGRLFGAMQDRLLFENKLLVRTQNQDWEVQDTTLDEISNLKPNEANTVTILSKIVQQGSKTVLAPVEMKNNSIFDPNDTKIATIHSESERWNELEINGQMRWNRDETKFEFNSVNGNKILMSSVVALADGVPLPYLSGRQISPENKLHPFYHLNSRGLWKVDSGKIYNVKLDNYADPVGVANGTFMYPNNKLLDLKGMFHSGPKTTKFFNGELEIVDDPRNMSVSSVITYPTGEKENNFSVQGFKHDVRYGVGWANGSPVILGPLKIVPTNGLSGFDYVTGDIVQDLSDFNGDMLAKINDDWFKKTTGSNWVLTDAPRKKVLIGQVDNISWELEANSLNVFSNVYGGWRLKRTGLAFDVDTIQSVAGTPEEIVISSKVGTHSLARASEIDRMSKPMTSTAPELVETAETSPGNHIVFAPRSRQIWQSNNWRNVQGTSLPWNKRIVVDSNNYKITFERGKNVEVLRRVSLIDGTDFWKSLQWRSNERLPTDHAQSLFVQNRIISVGTKFGLKSHLTSSIPQSEIVVFDSNQRRSSVSQIGKPENNPDSIFALDSNGGCTEIIIGGFRKCNSPVELDRRLVLDNYFWKWIELDNKIEGEYNIQNSANQSANLTSIGHWPHDFLLAHVECGNIQYELWRNGKVLNRVGLSLELLDSDTYSNFHCQSGFLPLDQNNKIDAGTYVFGNNSSYKIDNTSVQVASGLTDEIKKRSLGEIFHHNDSFLIQKGERDLSYFMYWPDNTWRSIGWKDGLPSIDNTLAIQLENNNRVSRVTPIGVLDHDAKYDELQLITNPVQIRSTTDIEDIDNCKVERIERLDGITHTTKSQTDNALQWRCANGTVMKDSPTSKLGLGNIEILEQDPFSTRVVVDQTNFWRWTKSDSVPGSKPILDINYKEESVGLSGGRFDMDNFRAIASPFNEIEIIGENGWWQQEPDDLSLNGSRRTEILPNPSEVISATLDTEQVFAGRALCLETSNSVYLLDEAGDLNSKESCGYWTGNDSNWTYRHLPEISSTAYGMAFNEKQIERKLKNGRFTDLTAVASPIPIEYSTGLVIAVPTEIGVGMWDTDRNLLRHYGFNDMNALIGSLENKPTVLWGNTSVSLFDEKIHHCKPLSGLGKIDVQKIDHIGESVYNIVGLDNNNGRTLLTVGCELEEEYSYAYRYMEVIDRVRYVANILGSEDATGYLYLYSQNNRLVLADGNGIDILDQEMRTGNILSMVVRHNSREVLFVTPDEIYLLDIDAAISKLERLSRRY